MKRILITDYRDALEFLIEEFGGAQQIMREGSYDLAIQNNKVRYCRNVRDDDFCSFCMFYSEDGNCAQRRIDYLLEEV